MIVGLKGTDVQVSGQEIEAFWCRVFLNFSEVVVDRQPEKPDGLWSPRTGRLVPAFWPVAKWGTANLLVRRGVWTVGGRGIVGIYT
jgi:hypothetical protein